MQQWEICRTVRTVDGRTAHWALSLPRRLHKAIKASLAQTSMTCAYIPRHVLCLEVGRAHLKPQNEGTVPQGDRRTSRGAERQIRQHRPNSIAAEDAGSMGTVVPME